MNKTEIGSALAKQKGVYLDKNGVARCKNCNGPRMCYIDIWKRWVPCICPCEEDREKQAKATAKLADYRKKSGIEVRLSEATFNSFTETENNHEAYSSGLRYGANIDKVMAKGQGIYIYGKPGVGKTYLAACIGNMVLDMGVQVKFAKVSDMLTKIKEAYSQRGDEAAILAEYINADLAILDDIGSEDYLAKRGSAVSFAQDKLFQLIDGRYSRKKATIFTSNYSFGELITRRGIQRKTVERIIEMSTRRFELKGESFRLNQQLEIAEF